MFNDRLKKLLKKYSQEIAWQKLYLKATLKLETIFVSICIYENIGTQTKKRWAAFARAPHT